MRNIAKRLARGIAILLIIPVYLSYLVNRWLTTPDLSLETHSQWMALLPGQIGNYLRCAFYRLTLEYCDPTATICFGVMISKSKARLGRNVYVAPRCMLGWVKLEDDVLLGPAVQVLSGPLAHGISSLETPIRCQAGSPRCVTIGPDSWIGAGSIVFADVGSQTVVGANSTVSRPLPGRIIAVGSPAKLLRVRELKTEQIGQSSRQELDSNLSPTEVFGRAQNTIVPAIDTCKNSKSQLTSNAHAAPLSGASQGSTTGVDVTQENEVRADSKSCDSEESRRAKNLPPY